MSLFPKKKGEYPFKFTYLILDLWSFSKSLQDPMDVYIFLCIASMNREELYSYIYFITSQAMHFILYAAFQNVTI